MKKWLVCITTLALMALPATAEPGEEALTYRVKQVVETALAREADRQSDAWAKYLLSQPLDDFECRDNADLTGAECSFSVPAWDPGEERMTGDEAQWLAIMRESVLSSRVEGRVEFTLTPDGDVTLGDGLDAFVRDVAAAARSAKAAFDKTKPRQALAARLLPPPPHYGEDGAPDAAFAALCAAYADRFSPGELQMALSLVREASLGVQNGPGALRLVYYTTGGDSLSDKALPAALDVLKTLDKANAYARDELMRVYASAVSDAAAGFRSGSVKGDKQVMTIDIERVMAGELANDDFARYVTSVTGKFTKNLDALAEEVRKLPDYPRREQPESGQLSGPEAGTKLTFQAPDDGYGRYVWLVDGEGVTALIVFVRSGGSVVCYAPEGVYTVYTAKGVDWFGPIQLFGDQGEYSQSGAPIEVLDELHYHVITLGDKDGNTAMNRMDFTDIGPAM